MIDVVEADIIVHFSRHFLGGWHGFAVVSDRGLSLTMGFLGRYVVNANYYLVVVCLTFFGTHLLTYRLVPDFDIIIFINLFLS